MPTQQVFANRITGSLSAASTRYTQPFGFGSVQTTDTAGRQIIGVGCSVQSLKIELDTAPGSGKSWTFTLRKNNSDTILTLVIADSATSGEETTQVIDLEADDYVSLSITPSGTPSVPTLIKKSIILTSGVNNRYQAFFSSFGQVISDEYLAGISAEGIAQEQSNETDYRIAQSVSSVAMTIREFHVGLSGTPDTPGRTMQLRVNNADVSGAVATIDTQFASVDALAVEIEPGDLVTFYLDSPGGSSHSGYWTVVYDSEDGQSFGKAATASWGNSAPVYLDWAQASSGDSSATLGDRDVLVQVPFTIQGLSVTLEGAPGAGKSWTYELLANGVATGVSVTIEGTDTTGSTGDTYEVASGVRLVMKVTPTNSPNTATTAYWYWSGVTVVVEPDQYRLMLSDGDDPDIPVLNITPLNVGKSGAMFTRFERGRERAVVGEPPRAGALSTRLKNDSTALGYTGAPSAAWTLDEPTPGLAVRLNKTLDGGTTWNHLAQGNIDSIQHHFGADGFRSLIDIRANGPFAKLAGKKVTTRLYQNITTGAAIAVILNEAGFPSHLRDLDDGVVTLEWWWLSDADAMSAIVQLTNTEGLTADLYEAGDGKITFRDRNARYTEARSATSQTTFTSEGNEPRFTGFDYTPGFREIVNEARATRYRLTVDPAPASDVVWSDADGINYIVPPDGSIVVEATTTLPVSDIIPPVAGTDYAVGIGSVTASVDRSSGSRFRITFTAPSTGATLADLQLRANTQYIQHGPIDEISGGLQSIRVDVASSVAAYGLRPWSGTMWSYVGHADMRDNLDVITTVKKDPRAWVRIGLNADGDTARNTATAERELGDRIRIINSNPGVEFNEFCWIERIEHEVQAPEREITHYECTPITGALGTNPYDDITNGATVDTSDEGGSATGTGSTGSSGSSSPSPIALYGFAAGNQLTTFNGVQRITGGDATNIANLIAAGAAGAKILVDNGVSITLTSQLVLASSAKLYVPHGGSASISGGALAGAAVYLNGATDVLIGGLNITSAPGDYTSSNNPASAIEITGASDRIQIVGTTITSPTFGGSVTDAPEGVNIWNNGVTVAAGPGSVTFYRVYWPVAGAGNSTAKSKGVIAGGTTIATRNALTFYECVFSAWQRLPFVQDGAIADIVNCVYPNIDRIDAIEVADGGEARARASVFRNSTDGSHAWETRNLGGGYIAEGPEANDYQNSATFTEVSPFQVFSVPYSLTVNTAAYVHANVESNVGAGSVIIPE